MVRWREEAKGLFPPPTVRDNAGGIRTGIL